MNKLTVDRPKALLKVCGSTLIRRQIKALNEAGIDDIAIATGYKKEAFSEFSGKRFHNQHWQNSNMVFTLYLCSEWLSKYTCIISYSDIFYQASAIQPLISCSDEISILYDPQWINLWSKRFHNPLDDAESFRLSEDGVLIEIGNDAETIDDIQGQYVGILRITPQGWIKIKSYLDKLSQSELARIDMTTLLSRLIKRDIVQIRPIPIVGPWGEADTPTDLALYNSEDLS